MDPGVSILHRDIKLAEVAGFEPARRLKDVALCVAGRRFKPLSHTSEIGSQPVQRYLAAADLDETIGPPDDHTCGLRVQLAIGFRTAVERPERAPRPPGVCGLAGMGKHEL